MKKLFLILFVIFDLALLAGSAYVLFQYVNGKRPGGLSLGMTRPVAPSTAVSPIVRSTAPVVGSAGKSSIFATPTNPSLAAVDSSTRHISFSYRSPHARQVAIRAEFTGWKAEPMKRNAAGVWVYQANLTPGEYAYCFSVDDRPPAKDPANKRTKLIGRAVVSAIVVEPLSSNK